MNQSASQNKAKSYRVKEQDLPVSCPTKDTPTWDLHPKVYLEFDETGQTSCQYCGNKFIIEK